MRPVVFVTGLLTFAILLMVWLKLWVCLIPFIAILIFFLYKKRYLKFIEWHSNQSYIKKEIFSWSFIVIGSIGLALTIKATMFDIFRLPSNSMANTITNGDLVFIDKFIAGPRVFPNSLTLYNRASGFSQVKRNDLIVFNFPEGDTLLTNEPRESYYALKRRYHYSETNKAPYLWTNKKYKPVNKRPKYIKRLIGLPGDTVSIINGQTYVNNEIIPTPETAILKYQCNQPNPDSLLNSLGIKPVSEYFFKKTHLFEFEVSTVSSLPVLQEAFQRFLIAPKTPDPNIFPYINYWNGDNLGPVVIPRKGQTIDLTIDNIIFYSRIIDIYEENDLEIRNMRIYVNGKTTETYTFKMDYYWVLGDNRSHSYDSRYWGFLPENHIIGVSRSHFHLDN